MPNKEISKKTYIGRVNAVMDYIEQNIDGDLNLSKLSSIAMFSPFHFHRIFSMLTGETLNQFIRRIRIEKSASLILTKHELSLSEIATKCGFSNLSVFSRCFKDSYGVSATNFKNSDSTKVSKIGQTHSKNYKIETDKSAYISTIINNKNLLIMDAKIEVKQMPELNLIYVRHTGDFNLIGKAYEKLFTWAGPRGLLNFPETKTVTVYHDDPSITDMSKVRQSAAITISKEIKPVGEIGKLTVSSGKHAVGRFEIDVTEFEKAWNSMCLWLTNSGWQPAEGNPYELYHNDHEQHPEKKFILDICFPVKPL